MPTININENLIYKYYAPNEYNLDALLNHYFWFSKRECLNDPFDIGNYRKGNQTLKLHNEILCKSLLNSGFNKKGIKKIIPEYAICSFSRDGLNKQMWAYYAKDYSGWCLAFKRGRLNVSSASPLLPAIYVDDSLNPLKTINDTIYGNDPIERGIRQLFCKKHQSWLHEKEERIILRTSSKQKGEQIAWDTFELDHITLGNINRINSPYRNIILTIAQAFNVDVYEIDLSQTDFQLTKKLIQSKVNI